MRKIMIMAAASMIASICFGQVPNMQPPAEMQGFGWMVGEWMDEGTWTMEGMDPMKVATSFKAEWDGQFLKQSAVNDFSGFMKMTETMMLGYDAAKKQYVSYSFTNMAPVPRVERGTMNGQTLTMTSDPWEVMGEAHVSRATMTKVNNDELKMKLEFQVEGKWTTVMDTTYKRKK